MHILHHTQRSHASDSPFFLCGFHNFEHRRQSPRFSKKKVHQSLYLEIHTVNCSGKCKFVCIIKLASIFNGKNICNNAHNKLFVLLWKVQESDTAVVVRSVTHRGLPRLTTYVKGRWLWIKFPPLNHYRHSPTWSLNILNE